MNAYAAIPWAPRCRQTNMLSAPALSIGPLAGDIVSHVLVPRRLMIARIQETVAEYYQIPLAEMKSDRKAHTFSHPRQVAMYLARELTPKSYPEIGRLFGGKDHTTVMFAVQQVEKRCREDDDYRADVALLRDRLEA